MTVSSAALRRLQYTGDGVTTGFPVTFPFIDASDLIVTERVIATGVETVKAITTHYTVSGGGSPPATGTVTAVAAPASTVTWTITTSTPKTQLVDFVETDDLPAASLEQALDRPALRDGDLQEQINRCIKIPVTDAIAVTTEVTSSLDRAGQYLGFDSSGNAVALAAPTDSSLTTPFSETLLSASSAAAARGSTILDAQQDVFTTRGDIVRAGIAAAAERLGVGTLGKVLRSDATDPQWETLQLPDVATSFAFKGALWGLGVSNNVADATNDIDIAIGACRDAANATFITLATALTKRIDATWVVGTNQGGRPTAVALGAGWYHVFVIATHAYGVFDAGFDTSLTAVNLLAESGYTLYRRIGSVLVSGAPAIKAFTRDGDTVLWTVPVLDINAVAITTSDALQTLASVPLGFKTEALIHVAARNVNTSEKQVWISSPDHTGAAPSPTAVPLANVCLINNGASESVGMADLRIRTDTAQRVRARATAASTDLYITTLGWVDTRGKDE